MPARKTPDPAVLDGLETVDAAIGRTAERIQSAQRSVDRYRQQYADLVALRVLLERFK